MRPTFIVIAASEIGGMEKRLIGMFLELRARGHDVRLVATRQLVERLGSAPEYAKLEVENDAIVRFEGGAGWFRRVVRTLAGLRARVPDAIFHFGLLSPLRLGRLEPRRTLYTIPNASLRQYNARGLIEVFGGVMRSARVDVLDPNVFRQLQRGFPWRRSTFSLTPGSFVHLELFRAQPAQQKRDRIVFVGLFSQEKQAARLAKQIPIILERLARGGKPATEIWMLGRDAGAPISALVNGYGDARAKAIYTSDVISILAESKVVLSLQTNTNYPSKALLEGMACGCVPIVSDVRDTERIAPRTLASYVPVHFEAANIADAALSILRRSDEELDANVIALRAFVGTNFSVETTVRYYEGLYESLSG